MELMQANRQWMTRPDDQRFLSLTEMLDYKRTLRERSAQKVITTRDVTVVPVEGSIDGLAVIGPNGAPVTPSH